MLAACSGYDIEMRGAELLACASTPAEIHLTDPPQYDTISPNLQVPVQRWFLNVHPVRVNHNVAISTLILVELLPLQELPTVGRSTG
jgi:hypothetical protein